MKFLNDDEYLAERIGVIVLVVVALCVVMSVLILSGCATTKTVPLKQVELLALQTYNNGYDLFVLKTIKPQYRREFMENPSGITREWVKDMSPEERQKAIEMLDVLEKMETALRLLRTATALGTTPSDAVMDTLYDTITLIESWR